MGKATPELDVPGPVEVNPRTYPVLNSMVRALKLGAVGFLLLVAAVAIYGGLTLRGFHDQHDRDQQASLQRRVDACIRDNKAREGQRELAATSAQSAQAFASILIGDHEITPEVQAQINQFNASVVEPFLALADPVSGKFAPRDCSPESVNNGG